MSARLGIEGLTAGYDRAEVIRDVSPHRRCGRGRRAARGERGRQDDDAACRSGIVKPIVGRITLDGDDLASLSPTARARLGIAARARGARGFFGLTVAEHFRLGHHGEQLDEEIAYSQLPQARGVA